MADSGTKDTESSTNTSSDSSCARVLKLSDGSSNDDEQNLTRTIGYSIVEAKEASDRDVAIVYFYPMSGCSIVVHRMAAWIRQQNFKASFLCVDRPGCGETTMTTTKKNTVKNHENVETNSKQLNNDKGEDDLHRQNFAVQRIREHVDDVCAVLRHERINTVYVLGVCLGHPYAVELCRNLCPLFSDSEKSTITCKGLSLVAPFVNAAPKCWRVAQWGAAVPDFVLHGFTEAASAITTFVMKNVLRPHHFEKIITDAEMIEFGWENPGDFEDACELMIEMSERTKQARAVEARLGANKIWQQEILDRFARENQSRESDSFSTTTTHQQQQQLEEGKSLRIPVRIYACSQDKLLPLETAQWLGNLYGCKVVIMSNIHSHEVMTFFAGPPRSPVMLRSIGIEWNLLSTLNQ